ncbi:hypothetical protein GC248_01695 [Acetobacter senegalensis]|nr:hypothetical protein [Acetobacter senegalensis]
MEDTPQEPAVFKNRRTEWNFHRRNHLGQQSEHCRNRPDIWVQTTWSHRYFPSCKTEPSTYGFFRTFRDGYLVLRFRNWEIQKVVHFHGYAHKTMEFLEPSMSIEKFAKTI